MAFWNKKEPTRIDSLEKADRLAAKKKYKKALAAYKEILGLSQDDWDVYLKLGSIYAKLGDMEDAWNCFKTAAEGYKSNGFSGKSLGVYKKANVIMPKDLRVITEIKNQYIRKSKKHDAIQLLLSTRKILRKKEELKKAKNVLVDAFELDEWNFDITYDLAKVCEKLKDKANAMMLYNGLLKRHNGKSTRKVRWKVFSLSPSFKGFYLWLRAFIVAS